MPETYKRILSFHEAHLCAFILDPFHTMTTFPGQSPGHLSHECVLCFSKTSARDSGEATHLSTIRMF